MIVVAGSMAGESSLSTGDSGEMILHLKETGCKPRRRTRFVR